MRVEVLLFAGLRELAGRDRLELQLGARATVTDAWQALITEQPALGPRRAHLAVAVNRRYARFDAGLSEGDEVAFIPPVSGG